MIKAYVQIFSLGPLQGKTGLLFLSKVPLPKMEAYKDYANLPPP